MEDRNDIRNMGMRFSITGLWVRDYNVMEYHLVKHGDGIPGIRV